MFQAIAGDHVTTGTLQVPLRRPAASMPKGGELYVGTCPLACRAALGVVAVESGLSVDDLLSSQRCAAPVAQARQLAMYLAHVALGLPQTEVARAFQRDRTTVAHACRRIEDLRDVEIFDVEVSRLETCVRWIVKG